MHLLQETVPLFSHNRENNIHSQSEVLETTNSREQRDRLEPIFTRATNSAAHR